MKERSQLNNRLPLQTLTYLATSREPWSLFQHKWQGNKRCYKILLRPQLSSIQSSQEQIEKYRDKKQTEGLKTTVWKNAAVTHIEPGWLTTATLACFVLSLSRTRKYRKSAGETTDIEHKMIISLNNCWKF